MRVVRKHLSLLALVALALSLALPSAALAQSAGDEQYTDPFGEGDSGGQTQEPSPDQPVEQPSGTPEPAPAPGGNGTAEPAPTAEAAPAPEAAQDGSPTLPRTGAPVILFAAIGYVLLLAGTAIRRKA
jgi:hypothetical protein